MSAAIIALASTAGLTVGCLVRLYRRRQPQRHAGMPVMLSGWSDGHESTVAVHLQRNRR